MDKQPTVYIQNGNAFQATKVELGRSAGDLVEVKRGLFEGDLVVTQRANQLYAESLKGDGGEDHSEPSNHAEATAPNQASLFPGWLMLPMGGAVIAGTFAAGLYLGRRRQIAPATLSDSLHVIDGAGAASVIPLSPANKDEQRNA